MCMEFEMLIHAYMVLCLVLFTGWSFYCGRNRVSMPTQLFGIAVWWVLTSTVAVLVWGW